MDTCIASWDTRLGLAIQNILKGRDDDHCLDKSTMEDGRELVTYTIDTTRAAFHVALDLEWAHGPLSSCVGEFFATWL